MATVYDVDAGKLNEAVAKDLRESVKLKKPEWANFVKTGANKERYPDSDDWWYNRAASMLRKVYVDGPIGVQRLRTVYGSRKRRGHRSKRFYRSGGKIIRTILLEFDGLGFTEKVKEGRKITAKGQSYLDKIASKLKV